VDAAWKLIVKLNEKHGFGQVAHEDQLDYAYLSRTGLTSSKYEELRNAVHLVRTQYGRLPWPT
jgi:hypothetical protein